MNIITSKTIETRRRFLRTLAAGGAFFTTRGLYAQALTLTPQQTPGPFYPLPDDLPLGKDNDLVYLNDNLTPASGTVTHIGGRVLTSGGSPIRGALVELWHADINGTYTSFAGVGRNPAADPNFAGIGQYLTGSDGRYRFRTIQAGLYPGRARHFHWGITIPGQLTRFTTQTYWSGEAGNNTDGILNGIPNAAQRASVILSYTSVPGSATGEVQTTWDIVMGLTPVDPIYPGGSLVVRGDLVPGPVGGNPRFRLRFSAYAGYSYEVYGNPTLGPLSWGALAFSLTQTGAMDRNIHAATAEGTMDLYVEAKSSKGFYYVAFRVPGANTGTP